MAGSVGDCLLRKGLLKMIEYTIIRSRRKTMCLQVKADGQVVVRAPLRMTKQQIQEFVQKHESWILKKQDLAWKNSRRPVITDQERREGMEAARRYIPQRVAYFAQRMDVTYGRITIREQKTRWGSCSSKGNLNFNWKLMRMPPEALDYVVVHELAHRKEMNHSERFWAIVEKELPDYRERRKMLRNPS
nr:M48 family metallopeptidase [uncultured Marvinbryantia sp.]